MKKTEYRFKVVIIGASGAGKSCLMKSICNENVPIDHNITIGVDYNTKIFEEGNKQYKFCLWDTTGNKAFMPIVKSYFNSSIACLLVFDLTDEKSFLETVEWYHQYKRICFDNTVILIGNKVDKINNSQIAFNNASPTYGVIGENLINKFIQENQIPYMETSAVTRQNIDDLLNIIKKDVQSKILTGKLVPNDNPGLTLHEIGNNDVQPFKHKNKKENIGCCVIC